MPLSIGALTKTAFRIEGRSPGISQKTSLINFSPAILNGGFETAGGGGADVFASWAEAIGGASTLADEGVIVHSGSHACKMLVVAGGNVNVNQSVLVEGAEYELQLWARVGSTPTSAVLNIGDGGGSIFSAISDLTETYVQKTVRFRALSNALLVIGRGAGGFTADIYIDDVTLTQIGLDVTDYPTDTGLADDEEVKLGSSDLLPMISEGINEEREFQPQENILGSPAISDVDLKSVLSAGDLQINGMYDTMDQLLACAMGFESPFYPVFENPTVGETEDTAGGLLVSNLKSTAALFTSADVGKFVRIVSGVGEGQVRRVDGYSSTTLLTVTPNWDVLPEDSSFEMADEFSHKYEFTNRLADQLWPDVYAGYPVGGIGLATDKIIRRGTLGIDKGPSIWMWRSCRVNTMQFNIAAAGKADLSCNMIPFDLDLASTRNTASTTWDEDHSSDTWVENELLEFSDVCVRIKAISDSSALAQADDFGFNNVSLSINNNLATDQQSCVSAPYRITPVRNGFREVTGALEVPRYEVDTLIAWVNAETDLMMEIILTGSTLKNDARTFIIYLPNIRLLSAPVPVAGPEAVTQSINFRATSASQPGASFPVSLMAFETPEMITAENDRDFDTNIGNWVVINVGGGNGTAAHQASAIGGHDKSAIVTVGGTAGTSTGGTLPTSDITAFVEGDYYLVEADVYIPSANNNWTIIAISATDLGSWVTVKNNAGDITLENSWQKISTIFKAAADVTGSISILGASTTIGDIFYYDNITIRKMGVHPEIIITDENQFPWSAFRDQNKEY